MRDGSFAVGYGIAAVLALGLGLGLGLWIGGHPTIGVGCTIGGASGLFGLFLGATSA